MRECIFHFKVIRNNESKLLRALIILDSNKQPSISDFIDTFKRMGYNVELENERELIFNSLDGKEPYKLDITKIEIKGETEDAPYHDGELRAIVEHLVKSGW